MLLPFFLWSYGPLASHTLLIYLRLVGATLCALLIVHGQWPRALQPLLPLFWHVTLLYCLPFLSTVVMMASEGSTEWIIHGTLSMLLLIVLADWLSLLCITSLGITLGLVFSAAFLGTLHLPFPLQRTGLLLYQALFTALAGFLFARRKQRRFEQLTTRHKHLGLIHKDQQQLLMLTTEERQAMARVLTKSRDLALVSQSCSLLNKLCSIKWIEQRIFLWK